jgi:outer membrane receptor protein involved in Fe transport
MHALLLATCCLVSGNVHAISGAAIVGARAELHGTAGAATTTDAHGDFHLTVSPGTYRLTAAADGFAPVTIALEVDRDAAIGVALEPLDSPKLRPIGAVTVDGRLTPILGTIPSVTISRSDLDHLGDDRIVDGLQAIPSATFTRPDGGAASAIDVVSLRGPDPSESLVALDGQLLNDGNTGDLDLSRFPTAAFSAIDVTEGLGPEDTNGSNTFGGAINLVSLRPTVTPHVGYSTSVRSFGESETWLNATGTTGRLGYAAALDDQNELGYVNETAPLYIPTDASCSPCDTHLGSTVVSHLGLASAVWSFSQDADITARVFLLGDARDESGSLNGVDENTADIGTPQYGQLTGPGEQSFDQTLRAYQIRTREPLGAGELTSDLSMSDNDVGVTSGGTSPYDIDHDDKRYNAAVTWQRTFDDAQFAVGGYTRYESLDLTEPGAAPTLLGQTIDVMFVRGGFQPSSKLRLDGGVFQSNYTSFGANLDGRFGAVYTADPSTSLRFSIGTGFRAPLLLERYQLPYDQLALDGNNVFVGQGSTGERPEHATEYELGASHEFSRSATLDVSLYQTNLRDPIEIFYPLSAVAAGVCANNSYANPIPACVSYNSNVGNAVYQGLEFRFVQRLAPQHLFLTARYGLNIAYPKNLNADFSNPTSGGNLVGDEQFLGIPQQQASLEIDYDRHTWHGGIAAIERGDNNELNEPPFTLVDALIGYRIDRNVDLSIGGTNLLDAAAGRFTVFGAGVPYAGVGGPLPTDAYHIEPAGFRVILTVRT